MALFQKSMQSSIRQQKLYELECNRQAFASQIQHLVPGQMLLIEKEGGFLGVCAAPDGCLYALSGPAPGIERAFSLQNLQNCSSRLEINQKEPEGAGGFMGMGIKGGEVLCLVFENAQAEQLRLELMPDITSFLFTPKGVQNPLTSLTPRRKNANIVWDLRPQSKAECMRALSCWV